MQPQTQAYKGETHIITNNNNNNDESSSPVRAGILDF
jgi:hypothetical protein